MIYFEKIDFSNSFLYCVRKTILVSLMFLPVRVALYKCTQGQSENF